MCMTCCLACVICAVSLADACQHCVLMPCDNVSDVVVDEVIDAFLTNECEVCFSLTHIPDPSKLSQMGVYDPLTKQLAFTSRLSRFQTGE